MVIAHGLAAAPTFVKHLAVVAGCGEPDDRGRCDQRHADVGSEPRSTDRLLGSGALMAQNWQLVVANSDPTEKSAGASYTIPGVALTTGEVGIGLVSFRTAGSAAAPTGVTHNLGNTWTKRGEFLSAGRTLSRDGSVPVTTGGSATLTITHGVTTDGIEYIVAQSPDVAPGAVIVGSAVVGLLGCGERLARPSCVRICVQRGSRVPDAAGHRVLHGELCRTVWRNVAGVRRDQVG